jgi:hypothetical protein
VLVMGRGIAIYRLTSVVLCSPFPLALAMAFDMAPIPIFLQSSHTCSRFLELNPDRTAGFALHATMQLFFFT